MEKNAGEDDDDDIELPDGILNDVSPESVLLDRRCLAWRGLFWGWVWMRAI